MPKSHGILLYMQSHAFASRNTIDDLSMISFYTDLSYELPPSILSCTMEKFQEVLTYASKLIELEESLKDDYTRNTLFAEYLKDIKHKHSQELMSLEKQTVSDMNSGLKPLLDTISEMEKKNSRAISEIKDEYENKINEIKKISSRNESEKAEKYQAESRQLTKRLSELEAQLQIASKSESAIRDNCKESYEKIILTIEEKNREILSIKEKAISDREEKVKKQEQDLQVKVQRQASSVLKGNDGEKYFKTIAKEKMNWDLIKTPTFSCDSSATINSLLTLFEIKNYSNSIPQGEVTKFLRDMKLHPEALFGVFVSLNTPIYGKNPNTPITIEWINGSQCVLYIQSCSDIDLDYVFSIIDQMNRITNVFNKLLPSDETESQEKALRSRIEQAKTYLDRAIQRGTKLVKKLMADKKQQIDTIETMSTFNVSELKSQNVELTTSIQILLSEYIEEPASDEISSVPVEEQDNITITMSPPKVKKAPRKSK